MRIVLFLLATVGFGSASLGIVGFLAEGQAPRYPHVIIGAPHDLRLTFLHKARHREGECEATTTNIVNLLQSACRDCRLLVQECVTTLNDEQSKLLSQAPLTMPSVRLSDGVVTYLAPDKEYALKACQESQRESTNTANHFRCFDSGSVRPLPPQATRFSLLRTGISPVSWAITATLAIAVLCSLLVHARMDGLVDRLVTWPRRRKRALIMGVDILCMELTLWLAFALRLDVVYIPHSDTILLFLLAPMVGLPVFVSFGLYRSIIRYLGIQAITGIAKAVVVYVSLLTFLLYMLALEGIPRSALAIHAVLAFLAISAVRGFARTWLQQSVTAIQRGFARKNVVIYGAGSAGVQLSTALAHSKELRPVAFIDDDAKLHRSRIGELEVFSPLNIQALIKRHNVTEVLLAIPSTSRFRRNEIINLLEPLPIQVRTLPGLSDLVEGKVKTDDLREVDIEDLLGRDPVTPDPTLMRRIVTGKCVMVTGAGGSIGSELCRQILRLQPKFLVLFEQSEFALYQIEQDLASRTDSTQKSPSSNLIIPLLGSVTDQPRLERTICAFQVDTIFHAAAYKHVPLVEQNPCEGVFNNVFGTYRAACAAINQRVGTFVLISTDKAVRPTNTMGTTKRFAEMILQAFANNSAPKDASTQFGIVRFGNVLGSSGSVVPLFREQIRRGGPVTVTDPRITRYFMTITEATQLVIQAGAMSTQGDVFVLDMGEPVKIIDLAYRMVHLSGLQVKDETHPFGDIEIIYTGLRPGEKLYEELLIGQNASMTNHSRIMRATEKMLSMRSILSFLERLEAAVQKGDSSSTRLILREAVEEFMPQCENEDLIRPSQQVSNLHPIHREKSGSSAPKLTSG